MQDASLRRRLQDLTKHLGVRRTNLAEKLGEELHELWYVRVGEPDEIARAKVTWQLERLVRKLGNEKHRQLTRVSYNLDTIDIPESKRSTLQARHNWMQKNNGLSYSRARTILHKQIIPEFVRSLRTDPPPPTPPEELVAASEAAIAYKNWTDVSASARDAEQKASEQPPTGIDDRASIGGSDRSNALDFPELIPFVPRLRIQREFQKLLDSGHRLIAFEGEPGNGKTRLARELLRERLQHGGTVTYIRMEQLFTDVIGAMSSSGIKLSSDQRRDPMGSFAEHLSSEQFPTYVLLDNIEQRSVLEALILPSCRSIVLVTSRESVLPQERGIPIVVKEMEREEAAELVRNIRPQTSETEIDLLITALGKRPIPIVHACSLIGDGYFYTVEQFCYDLSRDAATTFGGAIRPIEWTLTWIYEQIFAKLQNSEDSVERDAALLLKFMAFLGHEAMPYRLVALSFYYQLAEHLGRWPDELEKRTRLAAALGRLQKAYLIEPRPDGLSMHPLTQALLNGISRRGSFLKVLAILHGTTTGLLKNMTTLSPATLHADLIPWLPHILKIAQTLFDVVEPDKWHSLDIFGPLSIVVNGLRQTGRAHEMRHIRELFLPKLHRETLRLREAGRSPTSDGFRALAMDLVASLYDEGSISFDEYLSRISPILRLGTPEEEALVKPGEVILLAQRSLDGGRPVLGQLDEFDVAWPGWEADVPPEFIADFRRQRGESYLLRSEWRSSRSELEAAWNVYETVEDRTAKLRGQTRTLKDLLDLDSYSGVGFTAEVLERLYAMEVNEGDSALAQAFFCHMMARHHSQVGALTVLRHKGAQSEINVSYKGFLTWFLRAYAHYLAEGSDRLAIGLMLDWAAASVWEPSELEPGEQELQKRGRSAFGHLLGMDCWPNPLMGLMASGKIVMLAGSSLNHEAIQQLWDAAETGINDDTAVHLCCEAQMVGWLAFSLNRLAGMEEPTETPGPDLDTLRQRLERLGLRRRWVVFENAMGAIKRREESVFLLSVRTLLLF